MPLDAICDAALLQAVVNGHPDGLTFRGDLAPAVPIAHEVIRVADGVPVMRHVLAWSDATRRSSLSGRGDTAAVRWAEGVEGAVRAAVAHVGRHRPRRHARICLITSRPLARVLLRAWESPQDGDPVAASLLGPWYDAGVGPSGRMVRCHARSERLARALRRYADVLRCDRPSWGASHQPLLNAYPQWYY